MNDTNKISELLKKMAWEVGDIALFQQAVTHSSYAFENEQELGHNERLEFLGDAVLDLVVSEYLYKEFPELPEGELSRHRANLVCEETLSELARSINLGSCLLLGKGEESGGGRFRPSVLADAVEAIIGAIFLDSGFGYCSKVVIDLFKPFLDSLKEGRLRYDYKTLVQELAQARLGITPVYRLVKETGPAHQKLFTSQILLNQRVAGNGEGRTKKEAEQLAAKEAWEELTS